MWRRPTRPLPSHPLAMQAKRQIDWTKDMHACSVCMCVRESWGETQRGLGGKGFGTVGGDDWILHGHQRDGAQEVPQEWRCHPCRGHHHPSAWQGTQQDATFGDNIRIYPNDRNSDFFGGPLRARTRARARANAFPSARTLK